jgi:hypothetical protein
MRGGVLGEFMTRSASTPMASHMTGTVYLKCQESLQQCNIIFELDIMV